MKIRGYITKRFRKTRSLAGFCGWQQSKSKPFYITVNQENDLTYTLNDLD